MRSGVYKITNILNNKFYIGSTQDLSNRRRNHFSMLRNNRHHSIHLQRSCNKHGINNFKFEILEYCSNTLEREQYYIDTLKPSYNINLKATNRQDTPNIVARKLTKEQVIEAFRLKQEGYNNVYIANLLNYDSTSLCRIFNGQHYREITKDLKIERRTIPYKTKMKLSESDILIILDRLKNGELQRIIAKDMNIDQSTVSGIKKRRSNV